MRDRVVNMFVALCSALKVKSCTVLVTAVPDNGRISLHVICIK